ncbi:MAG TPA: TadE/TadG family type IV pilus assembly protein [Micromonosporaceae bacterium]|nr:TadE/TadG family type IV pilus assembly protein [Micromonosporaceae bacterium]
MRSTTSLTDERGTALVEFALVLPLFLFLVIGMLHFGKAFNYWINETHLANEAARFAVVNKNPGGTASSLQEYVRQQAETDELKDGGTDSVPKSLEVCIEFPQGPAVGAPVTVTVRTEYHWLPFIADQLPGTNVTISGTATMRLEAPPTNYSAGCVGGAVT